MKKTLVSLLVAGLLVAGCTKSDSSNSVSHSVVTNITLSDEDGFALYEKLYEDFLALENIPGFTLKLTFDLTLNISMEVPGYGPIVANVEQSNKRNDSLNYQTQRYYKDEETVSRTNIPGFLTETEPEVIDEKELVFFDDTTNEKVYTLISAYYGDEYERTPSSKSDYARDFAEQYNVESYVEEILAKPDELINLIEDENTTSVEYLTDINRTTLKMTLKNGSFSDENSAKTDLVLVIGPDLFTLNISSLGDVIGIEALELKVANPNIDIHILDSYL